MINTIFACEAPKNNGNLLSRHILIQKLLSIIAMKARKLGADVLKLFSNVAALLLI